MINSISMNNMAFQGRRVGTTHNNQHIDEPTTRDYDLAALEELNAIREKLNRGEDPRFPKSNMPALDRFVYTNAADGTEKIYSYQNNVDLVAISTRGGEYKTDVVIIGRDDVGKEAFEQAIDDIHHLLEDHPIMKAF